MGLKRLVITAGHPFRQFPLKHDTSIEAALSHGTEEISDHSRAFPYVIFCEERRHQRHQIRGSPPCDIGQVNSGVSFHGRAEIRVRSRMDVCEWHKVRDSL